MTCSGNHSIAESYEWDSDMERNVKTWKKYNVYDVVALTPETVQIHAPIILNYAKPLVSHKH